MSNLSLLIAGSAKKGCDQDGLSRAHEIVRGVARGVLAGGGQLVVFLGAPTRNASESAESALTFDWTVIEELLTHSNSQTSSRTIGVLVTGAKVIQGKLAEREVAILDVLSRRGAIELIVIDDDLFTGGRIRDTQLAHASAVLLISGGKGVYDLAESASERKLPCIPLDIDLGGSTDEGPGASSVLFRRALSNPGAFVSIEESANPFIGLSFQQRFSASDAAERIVQLALEASRKARSTPTWPSIDILFVTILPVELKAMCRALSLDGNPQKLTNGVNLWTSEIESKRDAKRRPIGIVCVGLAGNYAAAAVVAPLIERLRPRIVLLVGIAAGLPGAVSLGDVLISERVVAFEPSALLANRAELRPESFLIPISVRQDLSLYRSTLNQEALLTRYSDAGGAALEAIKNLSLKVLAPRESTIASGEKLVRDGTTLPMLKEEIHGKIEALEMEAASLASVCSAAQISWLVVRGISDYADGEKTDGLHEVASLRAAVVASDIVTTAISLA